MRISRSFNSRAHGARDSIQGRSGRPTLVSIHARTGRATKASATRGVSSGFNSRAHGARDTWRPCPPGCNSFQFTRARGARQADALGIRTVRAFQFTRARGARRGYLLRPFSLKRFNSRAHGARDCPSPHISIGGFVSIHARTGRATGCAAKKQERQKFQFTRARGARPLSHSGRSISHAFQFTRARGARRGRGFLFGEELVSIHARTGRATQGERGDPHLQAFQFTRARGARLSRYPVEHDGNVSIHARTGRATVRGAGTGDDARVSIHARTGRATASHLCSDPHVRFQFTRARGARPPPKGTGKTGSVSIHARTGRATSGRALSP